MVVITKGAECTKPKVTSSPDSSSLNGHFGQSSRYDLPSSASASSSTNDCDSRGMLRLNQDVVINKGNLFDCYRMDKGAPCATGLYAQVKRCRSLKRHNSRENIFYAAKFSPRRRPGQAKDEECLENLHEIALLSQLTHPYIITFEDAFVLQDCVVTIMEFAPGGDLQSVIDADLVLLEKDASRYIYQLLEALKYLHERHIAHLDIKPQNLLLMGEFPTCDIKLCDFEISRMIKPGKEVKEILGTPDYVAPEILLYEPLSTAADMWSAGILCYVLLTGFSPFGGDTDQETFRNIIHEPIDFPDELFEDVSPAAIDFIVRVAVKNAKSRPSATEMEEHEWVKSFMTEVPVTPPIPVCEPIPEPISDISLSHTGPKKRSPRKTMGMSSTASATSGRRPSARSILRACKSDLYQMGGKTKSREALVERMKMALGEPSGSNWKFRINLSKSREQLWESKIQLSKSCERINHNLPDSTRWASVANFPSLDLGAGTLMKSSTSQESVISVMSTCTNIGSAAQQELLEWQQQSLMDDFTSPTSSQQQLQSQSVPNTPPIPNFDLSSPVNPMIHEGSTPINSTSDFPSLNVNGTNDDPLENSNETNALSSAPGSSPPNNDGDDDENILGQPGSSIVENESQKSVAELIMTFGGRVSGPNAKKLDLKNNFEPILEVDGSEEQPMSIGDCSDNNSTSGVSSIITSNAGTTPPTTKELLRDKSFEAKNSESGNYSMTSCSSAELERFPSRDHQYQSLVIHQDKLLSVLSLSDGNGDASSRNSSRRNSKTSQQIKDDMRSKTKSINSSNVGHNNICYSIGTTGIRRGSKSPPKNIDNPGGLKGILKKSTFGLGPKAFGNPLDSLGAHPTLPHLSSATLCPPGPPSRRGSIPGNCTRLHDTHTISSLAKVPKRSILKGGTRVEIPRIKPKCLTEPKGTVVTKSTSPESTHQPPKDSAEEVGNEETEKNETSAGSKSTVATQPKVIPKGLSPRERPSFILIGGPDNKSKAKAKSQVKKATPSPTRAKSSSTNTTTNTSNSSNNGNKPVVTSPMTPTPPSSTTSTPSPAPTTSAVSSPTSVTNNIIPPSPNTSGSTTTKRQITKSPESSFDEPEETVTNCSQSSGKEDMNGGVNESTAIDKDKPITSENNKDKKNTKVKAEMQIEPAAVAIKVFPPDPLIIPKASAAAALFTKSSSTGLSPEPNNNDDSTTTYFNSRNSSFSDNINNNIEFSSLKTSEEISKAVYNKNNCGRRSPDVRRKSKGSGGGVMKRSDKPMWGIVCTGSVGRAMERFETGIIKGKKLRRGSVPDF